MGRRLTQINADKESKNLRNHDNLRHLRSISRHILWSHTFKHITILAHELNKKRPSSPTRTYLQAC
ncbi:MAG: hypothetical protein KC419_24530 [Anaerolineales bacterium]|nr:hypothetical protein [Anaerolineales bacterium]